MTVVLDASVVVDAVVSATPAGDEARTWMGRLDVLQVPAILLPEVTSALRRMALAGRIPEGRARAAALEVRTLRRLEHPFDPFVERVWELRANLTVYDAWYVALAEAIGATLVTADRRLAESTGPFCPVEVIGESGPN